MAEREISIKKAIRTAQSTLSLHWRGENGGNIRLPVDPVQIANDLGLEVKYGNSMNCKTQLSGKTIWVNLGLSKENSRFATAHSLGHFLLKHGEAETDDSQALEISCAKPDETEANRFALELLIPADALRNTVINFRETDPMVLARIFGVDAGLVKHRMQGLGLTV